MSLVNVTIISSDCAQSRNVVALGVTKALSNHYSTTVFRPSAKHDDAFTSELIAASNTKPTLEQAIAACPCAVRKNKDALRGDIVASYNDLISATNAQGCVIVASDSTSVFDPDLFRFDASVAADLASPVFLSVCAEGRDSKQILQTIEAQCASVSKEYTKVFGVFVTDCKEDLAKEVKENYAQSNNGAPLWTLPSISESESNKFSEFIADEEIISALQQPFNAPTTPYAFQYSLLGKAKANKKTIVLPEGEEDRILKAADYLLERDIVNLIIVGQSESILARGKELGLKSLSKASFQSMSDEAVLSKMISKLCELRAKKGMTEEQAREQLKDASYFGTMLVVLGLADGLVSGSVNSTANTVRPALQVIKTKPGSKLVSGAFIMCFKDHVAVFADCAINLNPDAQQLADIALQSAQTAKAFGLDPKVGMLSYSTLGSGKGPDVDLVEEATKIVKESDPDLKVVGSIQFDAAWSETVAASKAKGNDVAGHVNVFVFPDLCAGNIGYKAVQRSSGALAVGPILQGLNKPVNDLSRGALVQDIINTVALTALEAQF